MGVGWTWGLVHRSRMLHGRWSTLRRHTWRPFCLLPSFRCIHAQLGTPSAPWSTPVQEWISLEGGESFLTSSLCTLSFFELSLPWSLQLQLHSAYHPQPCPRPSCYRFLSVSLSWAQRLYSDTCYYGTRGWPAWRLQPRKNWFMGSWWWSFALWEG